MKIITLSVLLFAWLAATPSSATAAGEQQEKQEIQARIDEFTAAWNRHDAEQMAAVWAEDGDLINPFGRKAVGRDEVRGLLADEHAGVMKQSKHEMKVASVRMVGDVALVDLDSSITGMRHPETGAEMPPMKLHIFAVMTKQDGKWMILSARPYSYLPAPEGEGS